MVERKLRRRVETAVPKQAPPAPAPVVPPAEPSRENPDDEGLVGLMIGLKFDRDNDQRLNCPSCGEEVTIDKGQCPNCHEIVRARDPHAFEARVFPIIEAKRVVYVHLDVSTGEMRFVRKTEHEKVEMQEIRLDAAVQETTGACHP